MVESKEIEKIINKRLINEPLSFGFFNKKFKNEYIKMKDDFRSKTADRMNINDLIHDLEKIKTFCETHVKSKYSEIFIKLTDRRLTNSEDLWEVINCLTITLGRLESDEEYDARKRKEFEENKKWEEKALKQEAKRFLELKKRFEGE